MCKHNDIEGYDCLHCCYNYGVDDGIDGVYDNPYKNFDQSDAYQEGYADGKEWRLSRNVL